MSVDSEKRHAAEAAAKLAEDGMTVGLGTGTTVEHLVPALAARGLDIRCVATSPRTEAQARGLGLEVVSFEGPHAPDHLDLAIDGADQVGADGWLVKGGGGAHTREKRVAAAAARFGVIVSSDKLVERVGPPIPLELLAFGLAATLRGVGETRLRAAPLTPDGGILADFSGDVGDPRELSAMFAATPGVVEHGLFPPELVWCVLVGDATGVRRIDVSDARA